MQLSHGVGSPSINGSSPVADRLYMDADYTREFWGYVELGAHFPQSADNDVMGFRFHRRIKLFSGVRLNLSRSGISTSIGTRGAWFTFGKRGTRATVGLPGTGLSYTHVTPRGSRSRPKRCHGRVSNT